MTDAIRLRSIPLWELCAGEPKWGKAELMKRRSDGPRAFDRGFRMQAFSDDEATFPSFKDCEVPGVSIGDLTRSGWPKFTGVDLSGKKRPGNAIVTVAVDPSSRRRFPVDVRFGKWSSSELAQQLNDVDQTFNPVVVMVENNGYQQALIDWVEAEKDKYRFWMKLEPTTTTEGNKADAAIGLPGLEIEFKNRAWVFPLSEYEGAGLQDEDPRRRHWARLAAEFRFHPIASTSDGVMATWFARQGIAIYGGLAFEAQGAGHDLSNMTTR